MDDIKKLEDILKLMQKYKVRAVKVGDIEVADVYIEPPMAEFEKPTPDDMEDEDLLFYST